MNKFKYLALSVLMSILIVLPSWAGDYQIVRLGPEYFPKSSAGRPIALGEIYVGLPDTDPTVEANQKTLYVLQEDGTRVAVDQPISTGAGGVPLYEDSPVTLVVSGDYSLKVLNSAGSQVYYVPSHDQNQTQPRYPNYLAADQGATGSGDTVKAYVDSIGANNGVLYFENDSGSATTAYNFDTSESIPANIICVFEPGAYFDQVTGNETVTVYSPENIIAPRSNKIFDGDMIDFSVGGSAYSNWWGTTGDDIQYAINSIPQGVVALHPGGSYSNCDNIALKKWVALEGNWATLTGDGSTYVVSAIGTSGSGNGIEHAGMRDVFIVPGASSTHCFYGKKLLYCDFENVLCGQRSPTAIGSDSAVGFMVDAAPNLGSYENQFRNIVARNCGGNGIVVQTDDSESSPLCNANQFIGVRAIGNGGAGLTVTGAYGNMFTGVHVEDNTGYGLVVGKCTGGAIAYSNQFVSIWNENNTAGTVNLDTDCTGNTFIHANSWATPDAYKSTVGTTWQQAVGSPFRSQIGFDCFGAYGFRHFSTTDAQPMTQLNKSGLFFGAGGASAVDVKLYRSDANILKTDDHFVGGGGLATRGDPGGTAGENTFTNAEGTAGTNAPTMIHLPGTTDGTQDGWLKIYIGTTTAWIPYWND